MHRYLTKHLFLISHTYTYYYTLITYVTNYKFINYRMLVVSDDVFDPLYRRVLQTHVFVIVIHPYRDQISSRLIFPGDVNEILCHPYCRLVLRRIGAYIRILVSLRTSWQLTRHLFHLNFEDHSSPQTKRWRKLTSLIVRPQIECYYLLQVESSVRDQPRLAARKYSAFNRVTASHSLVFLTLFYLCSC